MVRGFRGFLRGYPFDGPERPQHAARAAFLDHIARNREPADVAPVTPMHYFGSTGPIQRFTQPARINRPDTIAASRRDVPLAQSYVHRASRKGTA